MRPKLEFFPNEKHPFFNNLIAGSITGTLVLSITNPIWLCKTRLCLQYENQKHQYVNLRDCFRKVYKYEGIRGFYKVNKRIIFNFKIRIANKFVFDFEKDF